MLGFLTAEAAFIPLLVPSVVSVTIFSVWPPEHTSTAYAKATLQAPRRALWPPTQEGFGPVRTSPEEGQEEDQAGAPLL